MIVGLGIPLTIPMHFLKGWSLWVTLPIAIVVGLIFLFAIVEPMAKYIFWPLEGLIKKEIGGYETFDEFEVSSINIRELDTGGEEALFAIRELDGGG